MTTTDLPIGDDDLQAFVDGRLSGTRRDVVERFLSEHPHIAAQIALDRTHMRGIRSVLFAESDKPIPERLNLDRIVASRRRRTTARVAMAAGFVLALGFGSVGGWLVRDLTVEAQASRSTAMADEAIAAHRTFVVEVLHPVEVRSDDQAHLLQWLSNRLGRSLSVPDLTASGFRLMGGRVLPTAEGQAAMLMYDDDAGTRATLFVTSTEADETSFRFVEENGYSAFFWNDDGLGYVVVADLARERLLSLATDVYRRIEPGTPRLDRL